MSFNYMLNYHLITGSVVDNRIKKNGHQISSVYSTPTTTVYIAFSTLVHNNAVLLQMGDNNSDHAIIEVN